jgi:hypothetical protein
MVNGVDLSGIRNRNEARVAAQMAEVLQDDYQDYILDPLDIEDIYALALNLLPARYTQRGSIVLHKKPTDHEVRETIRDAADKVLQNPTRASGKE